MRKFLTAGLSALAIGATAITAAAPAAAQPYHGNYGYHYGYHYSNGHYYNGWGPGAALAAGIIGLGVGAAIANSHPYYYGGPGYYGGGPGYYGTCYSTRQVWDPYYGRWVIQQVPYAC